MGLSDRFSVDGRPGSYKEFKLPDGGVIIREGWDEGFSCIHIDDEGGEGEISQTSETNSVRMGKYATVFYDREGHLLGMEISLLCVGILSATSGIAVSKSRAEGLSDYLGEKLDMRASIDVVNPGVTFLECNSKGPSRIVSGARLLSTETKDCIFTGATPFLDLPITIFRDGRSLFVCVSGNDGYAWVQFCKTEIDPNLFKYGLSAGEIDEVIATAFPPQSFIDERI